MALDIRLDAAVAVNDRLRRHPAGMAELALDHHHVFAGIDLMLLKIPARDIPDANLVLLKFWQMDGLHKLKVDAKSAIGGIKMDFNAWGREGADVIGQELIGR